LTLFKRPGSFRIVCISAVVLAASVAAVLGVSASASASPSPTGPAAFSKYRGIVHAKGAAAPQAVGAAGVLQYHGGPVMRTNKVYAIFWSPNLTSYPYGSGYQQTISSYFQNVAADSGKGTNVFSTTAQYSDSTGPIAYSSTFGGAFVDSDPYPANGCSDSPYASKCLSDVQIQTELQSFVSANGLPINLSTMYFMFTPIHVGSCFSVYCSYNYYCAYHSNGDNQHSNFNLLYANMPYADQTNANGACDAESHPNGNDADATINVTSHEHAETITDPLGNAWYAADGEENGDLCAWNFGTQLGGSGSSAYNQAIGTGHYELQGEYSNASGGCAWSMTPPTPPTPPAITDFSPKNGAGGASVIIKGSGFMGVTGASGVTFNGQNATTYTVDSDSQITAVVPCGGAGSGSIVVSDPAGTSTSASSFSRTLPTAPQTPTFTPASGPVGASVTVNASDLACATSVAFTGASTSAVTVVSPTQVKVAVPSGAQTGPITVTNPGGTSAPSGSPFTVTIPTTPPVITSFSPTFGAHGKQVTINGSGFTGATKVTLHGVSAAFTFSSDTKIVAIVPTVVRGLAHWTVTTPGGTTTSSRSFYVTG
jgi:hypothetical protein